MPRTSASISRNQLPGIEVVARIAASIDSAALPLEQLFDDLPNVVFFIKDSNGRYTCVNQTLVDRCGVQDKQDLLGHTVGEVFPEALAACYERQDRRVLRSKRPVLHELELHWYRNRQSGWCLTNKYPLRSAQGDSIVGLIGISRDLETLPGSESSRQFPDLARVLAYAQEHLDEPLKIEELARYGGMSMHQLETRVQRVFHVNPRQLLMKLRLDEALRLLSETKKSLTDIALETGFCDQSAFTRHFRRMTGMPPGLYRTLAAPKESGGRSATASSEAK